MWILPSFRKVIKESQSEIIDEKFLKVGRKLLQFLIASVHVQKGLEDEQQEQDSTFTLTLQKLTNLKFRSDKFLTRLGRIKHEKDYHFLKEIDQEVAQVLASKAQNNSKISDTSYLVFEDDEEEQANLLTGGFNQLEISQIEDQVRIYLNSEVRSYKSELNLLITKFNFNLGFWKRSLLKNGVVEEKNEVLIKNKFSQEKFLKFIGKGKSHSSKKAKEFAAFSLLKQIFQLLPEVFENLRQWKKENSLKA